MPVFQNHLLWTPKKKNNWALEYIDLGCLLHKKQSKVKFQPIETSEGGMAWKK